jgi:hypothetical protein
VSSLAHTILAMAISLHSVAAGASEWACSGFSVDVDSGFTMPPGLDQAVCQYYEMQERRDWNKTYSLRPGDFRKLVPYELYEREMSKHPPALGLARLHIRSLRETRPSEIMMTVDFYRGSGGASKPMDPSTGSARIGERTEWVSDPDGWKCAGCGEVFSFTMNTRMVFPN